MPTDRDPDLPGGSHDPTRANDPIDPTRAQDPVDPTRAQPGIDPTRRRDTTRTGAPPVAEPLRRTPDDDDRRSAAWLWTLLAAVLIGIVLFALLSQGDDDDDVGTGDPVPTETTAVDTTAPAETVPEDTTPDTTPPATAPTEDADATTTTAATDADDEPAAGAITTSDGTDLLDLVQGDDGDAERLAPYAGTDVTGEDIEVLEVVEGQGIWIGTDDRQRIFARIADEVPVEVGDRISFDGTLEENAAEGSDEAIALPDEEDAEQLRQQGHHLELSELTAA